MSFDNSITPKPQQHRSLNRAQLQPPFEMSRSPALILTILRMTTILIVRENHGVNALIFAETLVTLSAIPSAST